MHLKETLEVTVDKNEPAILARYLIELAQNYSNFYNNNKVLVDDKRSSKCKDFLNICSRNSIKNRGITIRNTNAR